MRNKHFLISPILGVLCAGIMVWALTKSVERHDDGWTIFFVVFLALGSWAAVRGFKQYLNSYYNPDA